MKTLIILAREESPSVDAEFSAIFGINESDAKLLDAGQNNILLIQRPKGKTPQLIANEIMRSLPAETDRIGVVYHQPSDRVINNIISTNYFDKYDFISTYSSVYDVLVDPLVKIDHSEIKFEKLWDYYNRKSPLNLTLDILRLALDRDGSEEVRDNRDNYPGIYCDKTDEFISTLIDGDNTLYRGNYNNLRNHLFQKLRKMKCL